MCCGISPRRRVLFIRPRMPTVPGAKEPSISGQLQTSSLFSVPEDGEFAARVFNATKAGNFSGADGETGEGKNILRRSRIPAAPVPEARIMAVRTRLLVAREDRPRPFRDDKVLADWNGLFIAALAQEARVTGNAAHLDAVPGVQ